MKQSRLMSLAEAVTNVVVSYGLAVVTQIIVFPWFGFEAGLGEHLAIGMAFVAVSLARGYFLRRVFNLLAGGGCPRDISSHVEEQHVGPVALGRRQSGPWTPG